MHGKAGYNLCMNTHKSKPTELPAKNLAKLYRALAHPIRLQLLNQLLQEDACVCHLMFVLRRPQPYVSQQLATLRAAGLVNDRREGQVVYYQLADPAIADLIALGQQVLGRQRQPMDLPKAVLGPIAECTCPKCNP